MSFCHLKLLNIYNTLIIKELQHDFKFELCDWAFV